MAGFFFDLQVNGFGGVDFQGVPTLAEVKKACSKLQLSSVSRILATFITDSIDGLEYKLKLFEGYRKTDKLIAKTVVGYHLEGPYLSSEPGYRGAHSAALMTDPDWKDFERLQKAAGGGIRLVTIAPERAGAEDFIKRATDKGVRISLGHTNANDAQIDAAIRAGATLCTHLGNGCPAEMHRHDNIIQRLLARDELIACFIPDGIHLPPPVLRNLVRIKPEGKVILTTDAMSAAGAGAGMFNLGTLQLEVGADQVVRMPGSPYFAGSALQLDVGVANAVQWLGLPESRVHAMASSIPAQALGFTVE